MLAAWHEALQIYKTSRHQWIHLQKWNFGICSIHIYSICFLCQHWKHKINNVVPVLNKAGRPSLPFLKGWPQEGTGLEDKLFAGGMEGSFSWEKLNMGEGREMSPSRRSLIWFRMLSLPYGQHEIWECWWPVAGHNVDYPFLFMQKPLTLMLSYIRLGTLRGNYFWHCEVYKDQNHGVAGAISGCKMETHCCIFWRGVMFYLLETKERWKIYFPRLFS